MADVPTWMQISQALVAPFIAGAVAVIGFLQWRTAHEKVVLDLFEKRFQVYLDVRRIVSRGGNTKALGDPGLPNEIIARGRFLFGPDVVKELHALHDLCVLVEVGAPERLPESLDVFFARFNLVVAPYMKMDHKRIRTPSQWFRERNDFRRSFDDQK